MKGFPRGILVTFTKTFLRYGEVPSNLKVRRLTVKCHQWWQQHQLPAVLNCVLCSASALLYDQVHPSLHLSVPEFPQLQHWSNDICHLLTIEEYHHKAFKSTTKGWGGTRCIKFTMLFCKSAMLKTFVYL